MHGRQYQFSHDPQNTGVLGPYGHEPGTRPRADLSLSMRLHCRRLILWLVTYRSEHKGMEAILEAVSNLTRLSSLTLIFERNVAGERLRLGTVGSAAVCT